MPAVNLSVISWTQGIAYSFLSGRTGVKSNWMTVCVCEGSYIQKKIANIILCNADAHIYYLFW